MRRRNKIGVDGGANFNIGDNEGIAPLSNDAPPCKALPSGDLAAFRQPSQACRC
jgi:hypothetical protein